MSRIVTGKGFNAAESNIDILASNYHFVDKTLTIHKFLTGLPHQLILRPRRCGKSHAISLLRAFLEAPSPGEVRPATLEAPFNGTLIDGSEYKDFVKEHYKAYPVLYMDLKDVGGKSLEDMYLSFRSRLLTSLEFCREELKRQNIIGPHLSLYRRLCELTDRRWSDQPGFAQLRASANALLRAPLEISHALHVIYGRRPIILVDEYEAPLNAALEHNYLSDASDFFGNMLSLLLKDNEHVERSFMVGVLKLVKSGWLSGLNNLSVYSLNAEDPRYGDSFLFTEQEVTEFLEKTKSSLNLDELKKYYNSYHARGPDGTSISLFNPWSVHHAIALQQVKYYWNQTSSYIPIRKAVWMQAAGFNDRLAKLAGDGVELPIDESVGYDDLANIKEEDLWGLLSYTGYLTPIFVNDNPSNIFCIPNLEVRQEWVSWLEKFIEEKNKTCFADINTLLDPLLQGDAAAFQNVLSKILVEHYSYYTIGSVNHENVYQVFLFTLLLFGFKRSYVVDMEKEAGYGRYDIRCWPTLRSDQTEIILELKAVPLTKKKGHKRVKKTKTELENDMKKQLDKAMEQLQSRRYYLKSPDYVTTVYEFGICFAGRLCLVRRRTRKKTQEVWTVEDDYMVPPQFQEREVKSQAYNSDEEARLEERDRGNEYVELAGSSSHHAAMEPEQTGARSSRKRSSSQQESLNTRSSPNKRIRRSNR